MALAAQSLVSYASFPGLQVCRRQVLLPERNRALLEQYPDLSYAVLMPWIEGATWTEIMIQKRDLSRRESLVVARRLAETLVRMEREGLAHCDLSGPNTILPREDGIVLVDVEEMYGPGFEQPDVLPSGTPGYSHRMAKQGLWGPSVDRFAGAVLLAEMLGWCNEQVREMAWGESYFHPEDMQQDTERYRALLEALDRDWPGDVAHLFERVWQSTEFRDCPPFGAWEASLSAAEQAITSAVGAETGVLLRFDGETGAETPEVPVIGSDAESHQTWKELRAEEDELESREMYPDLAELEAAYESDPAAYGQQLAKALIRRAAEQEDEGNPQTALESFRRASEVAPSGSPLHQEVEAMLADRQVLREHAVPRGIESGLQDRSDQPMAADQPARAEAPYLAPSTVSHFVREIPSWAWLAGGLALLLGCIVLGLGGLMFDWSTSPSSPAESVASASTPRPTTTARAGLTASTTATLVAGATSRSTTTSRSVQTRAPTAVEESAGSHSATIWRSTVGGLECCSDPGGASTHYVSDLESIGRNDILSYEVHYFGTDNVVGLCWPNPGIVVTKEEQQAYIQSWQALQLGPDSYTGNVLVRVAAFPSWAVGQVRVWPSFCVHHPEGWCSSEPTGNCEWYPAERLALELYVEP
jgi:hypothetical protein